MPLSAWARADSVRVPSLQLPSLAPCRAGQPCAAGAPVFLQGSPALSSPQTQAKESYCKINCRGDLGGDPQIWRGQGRKFEGHELCRGKFPSKDLGDDGGNETSSMKYPIPHPVPDPPPRVPGSQAQQQAQEGRQKSQYPEQLLEQL